MYLRLLQHATLFHVLYRIDLDLAEMVKRGRCPHCGGPLHAAAYHRKPSGGPQSLPEKYSVRHSLCCGREGCRRRQLPPSCLFWGRRVYWGAVVLVVTALRQRREEGFSVREVKRRFGIDGRTLRRWMAYFEEEFPASPRWRRIRGRLSASVSNRDLPASLLEHVEREHGVGQDSLVVVLRLLATGL